MFIHNIDPVLLKIGPLSVYYYSLVYILGFLLVYYLLNKHKEDFRLGKDDVESFIFYFIIAVVIGARLFEVLWDPAYYSSNPLKIFAVWQGGMAFHGGLIGAIIAVYYFCKKKNINFWRFADFIIIPAAFALALGRIANFINGEIVGTVTNFPWCFIFPGYTGCRHPVQLYAAAGRFALFGILIAVKKYKDGFLFWLFILLIGIGRFFCDFLREDARLLGLSLGQYTSFIMIVTAIFVLLRWNKNDLY